MMAQLSSAAPCAALCTLCNVHNQHPPNQCFNAITPRFKYEKHVFKCVNGIGHLESAPSPKPTARVVSLVITTVVFLCRRYDRCFSLGPTRPRVERNASTRLPTYTSPINHPPTLRPPNQTPSHSCHQLSLVNESLNANYYANSFSKTTNRTLPPRACTIIQRVIRPR